MPKLPKARLAVALGTAALLVGVAPPADATPPSPVTIQTVIDFSSFPFLGTFTVPLGADVLGCSAGTFFDVPLHDPGIGQIEKHITCTSGTGSGDEIVLLFMNDCTWLSPAVLLCKPGEGEVNGQWRVGSGTGHFAGLRGNGDFSVRFVDDVTARETLTGAIHHG